MEKMMQIENITTDLMRMLELKLLDHVPTGEFNKDNMTSNVMNNLLENIFMKSLNEVRSSGAVNLMLPNKILKASLEKSILSFENDADSIQKAFIGYLKSNQSEEVFAEASKMSQYLIGALPVLLHEYIASNNFS